jgi:hypothetical protein
LDSSSALLISTPASLNPPFKTASANPADH